LVVRAVVVRVVQVAAEAVVPMAAAAAAVVPKAVEEVAVVPMVAVVVAVPMVVEAAGPKVAAVAVPLAGHPLDPLADL
jgi:hypothetical protein